MSNSITFTFKGLLPNFNIFKVWAEEADIDVDNMTDADLAILEHCYKLLYRRYCVSNIRFTKPDHFYNELAITFDDEWKRYKKRYETIATIYNLTTSDFAELNRQIQNFANNPNDAVSNPLDPLSYISSQTFTANLSNKLQAYLLAIESLPSQYDEDFISKFQHLFMNVIPLNIPYYISEED